MKRTVEFPIGSDSIIRITRYSGTGRVNVHLITRCIQTGASQTIKFACSVGDLSEDVQASLELYDLGAVRERKRKYKYSQAWQKCGFEIDCCTPLLTEEVLKR